MVRQIEQDSSKCDFLIVIGTSLQVRGAAIEILNKVPTSVPRVLINRDDVEYAGSSISGSGSQRSQKTGFDVSLLGNCDEIVKYLCEEMCWLDDLQEPGESSHNSSCVTTFEGRDDNDSSKNSKDNSGDQAQISHGALKRSRMTDSNIAESPKSCLISDDTFEKLCAEAIVERKYSVKLQRPSETHLKVSKRRKISAPHIKALIGGDAVQSSIISVVTRSGRKAGYFVSSSKTAHR